MRRAALPRALRTLVPTVLPTRMRLVALTFDAGGDDAGLPRIVRTLTGLHVSATFFMTGHFAEYYPAWARRLAAHYAIANHTMNHLDLTRLSPATVREEVLSAQQAIKRITGRSPQPLFRFPYGAENARSLRIVNSLGYAAIGWTVDTAGWLGTSGGQTVDSVIRRALTGLRPGEIILMHAGANPTDRSTLDADALATIIGEIERPGYRFTSLPAAYAVAYPAWRARPGARTP